MTLNSILVALLFTAWLIWMSLLAIWQVNYRALCEQLLVHDRHALEVVRYRDDRVDFAEPWKWFVRMHRFLRESRSDLPVVARLKRLLSMIEILFVLIVLGVVTTVVVAPVSSS